MRFFAGIFLLAITSLVAGSPRPQGSATQTTADKPVGVVNAEAIRKLDEAIAPYVKKARATLPHAKKRFLEGLPKGEQFMVTTRLYDPNGKFEQVFVTVTSWKGQTIKGVLSSDPSIIHHKSGDAVTCKERDVLDWTISKPDGSEEGNFVGKFLDSYEH
jgi:uncharacterized protein YegJ (DUF2314 family)